MKKLIALILGMVCVLGLSGCGTEPVEERYCDSLAEAEKIMGFKLEAPESFNDSGTKTFRVSGRTLEIMYFNGKVISGKISKSDNKENLEGFDYGYTEHTTITDAGIDYALSGQKELVYLAAWENGKYSYFVLDGSGKSADEMVAFCKGIH